MNGLLSGSQTSGYDWNLRRGSRQYHRQSSVPTAPPVAVQLAELAGLEEEMNRYENDYKKVIDTVRSLYVFLDETNVSEFLLRHRTVSPILAEAEKHLRQFFKDAVFALRTTTDDQGWDMIYATVQWPGEPEDAMSALNAFDASWWLNNSYPAGVNLTFTYRLV
jgi:hypothetical protein